MKKLDQLTFTRFLAALAVVFFHSGPVFPANAFPFNPLFTSGQTAVSYFFVLSGFVLAYVYARPDESFRFWPYLKARVARIYPIYLISFVLTCAFYIEIMPTVKTGKVLANLFLMQAWNPVYALSFNIAAWSLSVEVFFYAVFPLAALWAARRPPRLLLALSLVLWALSQTLHAFLYRAYYPEQHNFLLYFPLLHLSTFLLGVAGGIWFNRRPETDVVRPREYYALLGLALGLVAVLLIGRARLAAVSESFSLDVGLLAPFFLVIVLALACDSASPLSRWLSRPNLVTLGDSSFALFILHVPIRWLGERWAAAAGVPYDWFIYSYWVLMIPLSVMVFLLIERPLRDRLRQDFAVVGLVVFDALAILCAVYAGFALQLGTGRGLLAYAAALRFMARAALPIYVVAFAALGLYRRPDRLPAWSVLARNAVIATLVGALALAGLTSMAASRGWIEGLSRTAVVLSTTIIGGSAFLSRWALRGRRRTASNRLTA
jgi:peptidoglycan/LPS O-acetylase OafA/YrhL